jgi:hypothetical protein
MAAVSDMDNSDLLAGSIDGDEECTAELTRRGNTVVDGQLQKTVKGSALINEPSIGADDVVTVTDGKITAVNGQPYP